MAHLQGKNSLESELIQLMNLQKDERRWSGV